MLHLVHQIFALIDAANGIELGACQAIGRAVDVIGNDDPGGVGVVRVESSKFGKILLTFTELPIPCSQGTVVEVRKPYTPGTVDTHTSVLQLHKAVLEITALCILPLAVVIEDVFNEGLDIRAAEKRSVKAAS